MAHNSVSLFVESRYKVNRKRIVAVISEILKQQEITLPAEVSVAVIGDRKMRSLNKKYRNKDKTTNVLSFSLTVGQKAPLPESTNLRLGDIVLSYPQIIRESAKEDMLVDDKVDELVKHGLLHLLGIHHEE